MLLFDQASRLFLTTVFALATICFAFADARAQTAFGADEVYRHADPRAADPFRRDPNLFSKSNSSADDFAETLQSPAAPAAALDPLLAPVIDTFPGGGTTAALQADGKIIVGGFFKNINGVAAKNIVRLNADYSIDTTFNAATNATIQAIAVQPDGKILIGGLFTVVNNQPRNRIARLNSDGSLDTDFNTGFGADSAVNDIELQPDGKILLGGAFFGVGGTISYIVARLNADGTIDTSFVSPFSPPPPSSNGVRNSSIVFSLALQSDNKIVVAGTIFPTDGSSNIPAAFRRLNSDGSLDSGFAPPFVSGQVRSVAVQSTGKTVFGGAFSTVGGTSRRSIGRLNQNGSLDTSFDPGTGANSTVSAVVVLPGDSLLIAGSFSTYNNIARNTTAKINPNGALDETFASVGGEFTIPSFAIGVLPLPNGKVLIVGSINLANNVNRNTIFAFNSNGSLDPAANFTTTALGFVRAIAAQPDGKVIIGGSFNRPRAALARFNADGSLDAVFNGNLPVSGNVSALLVLPDGKILVGSSSIQFGIGRRQIVRLNQDGTLDASFDQATLANISAPIEFAVQPNGKIVVIYRGTTSGNAFPRGGIARLNADGSLDSSFANSGEALPSTLR